VIDMEHVKLHDQVSTPLGVGLVQGRIRVRNEEREELLVSFSTKKAQELGLGKVHGIWHLASFKPEDCEAVK
jgi:hypothetical protein